MTKIRAWIRHHKNDDPNDGHVYVSTSEEEAYRWLSQYKEGYAWLEPLVSIEEISAENEACAQMLEISTSEILLMAGEMTAQELRTVKAVLAQRAAAIRRRINKKG